MVYCLCTHMVTVFVHTWSLSLYTHGHCLCTHMVTVFVHTWSLSLYTHVLSLYTHGHCLCTHMVTVFVHTWSTVFGHTWCTVFGHTWCTVFVHTWSLSLYTHDVPSLDTRGVPSLDTHGVLSLYTHGVPSLCTHGVPSLDTHGVLSLYTHGVLSLDTHGHCWLISLYTHGHCRCTNIATVFFTHMITVFVHIVFVHTWSLSLYTLPLYTHGHSLCTHMVTVFVHTWSLPLYTRSLYTHGHCVCRDKSFVTTNKCLGRQKFCRNKNDNCTVAAPANDRFGSLEPKTYWLSYWHTLTNIVLFQGLTSYRGTSWMTYSGYPGCPRWRVPMSSRWPTKSADAPVYDGEHCEHRRYLSVVWSNTVLGCQSGEEPSANQNRATFYVPREKPE